MRKRLTQRFADSVRAGGAFARYTDSGGANSVRGLHLIVKGGGASYVLRVKEHGRRYATDIGLGSVLITTLAEARDMAIDAKRRVARGESARVAKPRRAPSFAEVAAEVIADKGATLADGGSEWEAALKTYAFPRIGNMEVAAITPADCLAVLKPIWCDKHETARRLRAKLKAVFAKAIFKGFRADNPVDSLNGELPKPRAANDVRHEAVHHSEVANAIARARATRARPSVKGAFEFIMLTAARASEVIKAEWDEFDLDAALWKIPAAHMKTRKEHVVPLSARAVEILKEMAALRESDLVFPGGVREKPMRALSLRKLIAGVKGTTGKQATLHGSARASFRNWCAENGKSREIAERALAHEVGNKVEAAYNRTTLLDARRTLMQEWADYLAKS